MDEWTKVVTHPLGLAGFALFVVFMFLRGHPATQPVWLRASFVAMAFIALLGGLGLAYVLDRPLPSLVEKSSAPQEPTSAVNKQTPLPQQTDHPGNRVNQQTSGSESPAIANTGGNANVKITNPPSEAHNAPVPKGLPESAPNTRPKPLAQKPRQAVPPKASVTQDTSGSGSPAVANTGGDVTITITNP